MEILKRIATFFLGQDSKALLEISPDVDTTSNKAAGKDQIGKIQNKGGGDIIIDNSVHNHYHPLILPSDAQPGTPAFDEVKKMFQEQFIQQNVQFLAQQSDSMIVGYKDFEQNSEYAEVSNFFSGKIPTSDLQYLRTGLYVRYLAENNRKEESIRIRDGAIRNNPRARNIINLASAGYFEDYIKPIYNNSTQDFNDEYEEIVNYMPETIFVNGNMTVDDIMTEVREKLSRSEQYHLQVKSIMVNGLNQCVETIREAETEVRKKYPSYEVSLQTDGSTESLRRGKMRIELPNR